VTDKQKNKLDGCIVWNVYNTVFDTKRTQLHLLVVTV